jgi:tRNA wybutosine-synthesizing protein 3
LDIEIRSSKMSFDAAKTSLLGKLAAGVDFSPKGSIDAPIVQLVDFINDLPDFVTTSSCSGRISVYRDENCTKGVVWILVVHGVITVEQLREAVHGQDCATAGNFFIALKCEGFIVHIRCRDLDSGRKLHQIAMGCGFRESGLSVGQKMRVQLAIRTTAYGLELPIAVGKKMILDTNALEIIVAEANRRLRCNFARTDRLLLAMKREYSWPSMVCSAFPGSYMQRWGHSCTSDSDGHCMISGGYGVEGDYSDDGVVAPRSQSQLSTRKLSNILLLEGSHPRSFNLLETKSASVSFMHAESVTIQLEGLSLLIVSGGRESPLLALSCLRVYSNPLKKEIKNSQLSDFVAVEFQEYGDIPPPRWGHTLTALGNGSTRFLLYGGRDEQQVFGDAYILVASAEQPSSASSETSTTLAFTWRKINTPATTESLGESAVPSPRFFHAACCISVTDDCDSVIDANGGTYSHSLDGDMYRVLIHGGLLSLDDPVTCSRAYIFHVRSLEWFPFHNTASLKGKDSLLAEHGEDSSSYAFSELQIAPMDPTAEGHLAKASISAGPLDAVKKSNVFMHRFGHTITDIGCKSLVIAGGVSFEDADTAGTSVQYSGICIVDLMMSDDARLCGALREANLILGALQWPDNSSSNSSGSNSNKPGSAIPESSMEPFVLPCRDCRSHHRAVYDTDKEALLLLGGGALCMSFGAHYCRSVSLQLCSGTAPTSHTSNIDVSQDLSDTGREVVPINTVPSDISKEAAVVLLVPVSRVKLVKSFLEMQSTSWLDKKRRITASEVSDVDVKLIPLPKVVVSRKDFRAFDEKNRAEKEKEKAISDVKKAAVELLVGKSEGKEGGKVQSKKRGEDAPEGLMAVPVMPSFADILFKSLQGLSAAQQRDFCLCLGEAYFAGSETSGGMGDEVAVALSVKVGKQSVKASKTVLASGYRKADEYLESVVREHRLPAAAASSFPRKYEIVGSVLMIPEDSLQGPVWGNILPPPPSAPSLAPSSSASQTAGAVSVSMPTPGRCPLITCSG